jgi:hypothetical protein
VCGRQNELDRIATKFWGQAFDRETPAEICKYCLQIINGMGGIGKSALGEKYAVLWQKLYAGGVFYFNAESLAMLHISIRRNVIEWIKPSCDFHKSRILFDSYVICP